VKPLSQRISIPVYLSSPNLRQALGVTIFVLTINGYPLVGLLSTITNLDSQVLSIPFRAFVTSLVVLGVFAPTKLTRPTLNQVFLWLFLLFYLFRLLFDFAVPDLPLVQQSLLTYVFILVLPALSAGRLLRGHLPNWACSLALGLLGGVICLLASSIKIFAFGVEQTIDPLATVGRLAFVALNPISLGHAAVTTLICFLCLSTYRPRFHIRLLYLATALVAAYCLVLSGSRGPLVSLAACIIVFLYHEKRVRLIVFLLLPLLVLLLGSDSHYFSRFESMDIDPSSLLRLEIQRNSLDQFLEHPLFGSSYVDLVTGDYPHNLFLDVAMSMGLFGLLVLGFLLYGAASVARNQLRRGQHLLPLLFIQYFFAAQFSGTIWGMAPFFAVLSVLSSSRSARS
jgi:O-antigen ligase